LSREELYAAGKALREKCPRTLHAQWRTAPARPDALDLVLSSEKGRIAELLPRRHGRMARSAFTFCRGAALTMAYKRMPEGFFYHLLHFSDRDSTRLKSAWEP